MEMKNSFDYALPDSSGYFGEYGGSFIPPQLRVICGLARNGMRNIYG